MRHWLPVHIDRHCPVASVIGRGDMLPLVWFENVVGRLEHRRADDEAQAIRPLHIEEESICLARRDLVENAARSCGTGLDPSFDGHTSFE